MTTVTEVLKSPPLHQANRPVGGRQLEFKSSEDILHELETKARRCSSQYVIDYLVIARKITERFCEGDFVEVTFESREKLNGRVVGFKLDDLKTIIVIESQGNVITKLGVDPHIEISTELDFSTPDQDSIKLGPPRELPIADRLFTIRKLHHPYNFADGI